MGVPGCSVGAGAEGWPATRPAENFRVAAGRFHEKIESLSCGGECGKEGGGAVVGEGVNCALRTQRIVQGAVFKSRGCELACTHLVF